MSKKSKGSMGIRIIFVTLFLLTCAAGFIYISGTWREYTSRMHKEAVCLVSAAASFIDAGQISDVQSGSGDLSSESYRFLKYKLDTLKESNEQIVSAYLLILINGESYIIASSEASDYKPYNPVRWNTETNEQALTVFAGGEPLLSDFWTDSRGKLVSAFAPVEASVTGDVVAVLGVDYPAQIWSGETAKHVLHASMIVICVLILLSLLYISARNRYRMKSLSRNLKESETLFSSVFKQAPVGIALVSGFTFLMDMNLEFTRIMGRSWDEIAAMDWRDITHPDDLKEDLEQFIRFKNYKIPGYTMDKRFLMPGGSYKWINMTIVRLELGEKEDKNSPHICILQDIHERKVAEEALKESERSKSVWLENLPGMAYRCKYDIHHTIEFASKGCYELTGYSAESLVNNKEIPFSGIIAPRYSEFFRNAWARALELHGPFRCEYEIITAGGASKWVIDTGQGLYEKDGSVSALEGVIIDITESKLK